MTGSRMRQAAVLTAVVSAAFSWACISERVSTGPSLSGECALELRPDVPGSTVIIVKDFTFEPAQVTIKAGARVTWLNCADPSEPAHTSTADQGVWSSPLLPPGESFTHTFIQPGTFAYHCEPHPFMIGTIDVEP